MAQESNPYKAPKTTENPAASDGRSRLDRSGVGKRLVQIVSISMVGAVLGNLIGNVFFPSLRSSSGNNLLVVAFPVIGLMIWAVKQYQWMRHRGTSASLSSAQSEDTRYSRSNSSG